MKKVILALLFIFMLAGVAAASNDLVITVKDEITAASILNASVTASDGTNEVFYTTTDGTIEIPADTLNDGEVKAYVSADGYKSRWYVVTVPCAFHVYLPENESTYLIDFSLIDYTNSFNFLETRLICSQIWGSNNIVVSDAYFDASGVCSVDLLQNIDYTLTLESDGYTRSAGSFIPTEDIAVSLVVGSIDFVPDFDRYDGFDFNISKTETNVTLVWVNENSALIEPFAYRIYDNDTLVYSLDSNSTSGAATYTFADPTKKYKIVLTASTTAGEVYHVQYVQGIEELIDLDTTESTSDLWYNMIAIFIIFIIALVFSAKSAAAGALICSLLAAGFYAIGFLKINGLVVAIVVLLGLLAVLKRRYA